MTITNVQIKIFIISAIIGTIIYMFIYSKKGQDKTIRGYFRALRNCFSLAVVSIFIVFGIFLIKVCLTQPLYQGLIIPIVWFFIAYHFIKNILNKDYGLNIHIINPESKLSHIIQENKITFIMFVLFIAFTIATVMFFYKGIFNIDIEKEPNAVIIGLIVGLIFLCVTIFLAVSMYPNITLIIRNISKNKNDKNVNYLKTNKINDVSLIIFLSIFILSGILCLVIGYQKNNEYKEKTRKYIEIQGVYIGSKIYSEEDENDNYNETYSLVYSYEVNGKVYTIDTDYGTAFIPAEGTKKTILYNPNNPKEAIIEGNSSGNFILAFGIAFIIVPLLILVGKIRVKNDKIKKIIGTIKPFLIGVLFIGAGLWVYCFMCGGGNEYTLHIAIQTAGFLIIFPILFIVVGIILVASTIYSAFKNFSNKKKENINGLE